MFQIIWGAFNIILLFYFFYVCVRAFKLIKDNVSYFASGIFVLGILSILNYNRKNVDGFVNVKEKVLKQAYDVSHFTIEETFANSFDLKIRSEFNSKENRFSITDSEVHRFGFESGTRWETISIETNLSEDNSKLNYNVNGVVVWHLLGIEFYKQTKALNGEVDFSKKIK
ncbi:hypothetical protein [Flavobacterium terrigena]|uniref:Uncharacterized protein n=1 Tax=Flavobacterium terrigena TaxID=402734 RepID=A0A1H6WXM6_9FLAO|nr:hypothetical protein [Flavobacterium terrigena]SEJ17540.1 hypothetical protein SAMN05660918_2543 [Flavobacterium terrigena]